MTGAAPRLASRIEALTRDFDAQILLDGETLALLPEAERKDISVHEQIFVAGLLQPIDLGALDDVGPGDPS